MAESNPPYHKIIMKGGINIKQSKISKENFVEAINSIKESINYQEEFNTFFKNHGAEGCVFQPDCSDALIKLLHILFEKADKDNLIYNFCHNLNCVQKHKKSKLENNGGLNTNLNNAEELYDYLITENRNDTE